MTSEPGWLLLIHQIPQNPGYLRVKVWRRLHRVGAVAIKSSVYVLPATEQAREDFEWTLREIVPGRALAEAALLSAEARVRSASQGEAPPPTRGGTT